MSDPFDRVRAEVMLAGYDARWEPESHRYQVIAVEAEFSAPLINPETNYPSRTFQLAGKLDVLAREDGVRNVVIEHKTASGEVGPGSDYAKRLRLDGQVSVYYAGAAALGHPVDACLYDVLVKPGLRPLKATPLEKRQFTKDGTLYKTQRMTDETPEAYRDRIAEVVAAAPNEYFLRAEVVRLDGEVADAMADVWQTGRTIRENQVTSRAPRNPDACVRYGRTCEFFGVCTGESAAEDPSLFRRRDTAHSELAAAPTDKELLTASRLSAFRACPRLHHYKYDLRLAPLLESEALRFGTLIHLGLEAWWKATDNRLDAAMSAIYP